MPWQLRFRLEAFGSSHTAFYPAMLRLVSAILSSVGRQLERLIPDSRSFDQVRSIEQGRGGDLVPVADRYDVAIRLNAGRRAKDRDRVPVRSTQLMLPFLCWSYR
jgi:hypothetical protein